MCKHLAPSAGKENPSGGIKVAAIQTDASGLDPEVNLKQTRELLEQTADQGTEIALTVELFNREFFPAKDMDSSWFEFAEPIPGRTTNYLAKIARKEKINIIASVYERTSIEGLNYSCLALINSRGSLVGKYRKSHIPLIVPKSESRSSPNYEKYYYAPGNTGFNAFKLKLGGRETTVGMLICYDRNFPEAWRALALHGTEIVFLSSSSSSANREDKPELHEKQIITHAYENGFFVVSANRTGTEGLADFYGRSCVVDPWGRIASQARPERKPQAVVAQIDLSEIKKARARSSHFRDRRPELYSSLLE
jgi:predicted amidohydrolase